MGQAPMTAIEKTYRKMISATQFSLAGLDYLLKSQFAARLELYFGLSFLALYMIFGVDWRLILISILLFAILVAVEALNTAIEVIIDRISPEISLTGKRAKDLGSLAVMCLLIANLGFAAYAIGTSF